MEIRRIKKMDLSIEVKHEILEYIKSGAFESMPKLPSEETLSNLFGVSRITIRAALNELASEGIIFRRQGKGTFVNLAALEMKAKFNPVSLVNEMISNNGYKSSSEIVQINVIESTQNISQELNINTGDLVVEIIKTFYADGIPAACCVDYFDNNLLPNNYDKAILNNPDISVFDALFHLTNRRATWDKIEINAVIDTKFDVLNNIFKRNTPFLLLYGVNFDQKDQPLMYSYEYINTDFIQFNMIRQRKIVFA